jgi:oligoendopeptidase F
MATSVRAFLAIVILLFWAGPARSQQERDRARIADKYKWNLADLYPSDAAWRAAKDKLVAEIPQIRSSKGTLGTSPARLADALDLVNRLTKDLSRIYTYASLTADQDTRVSVAQGMKQEMQQVAATFGSEAAFVEPEVLKIDKTTLDRWVAGEPRLRVYAHYLDDIQRRRPHTLSDAEEKLLASSSVATSAASNAFNIFSNAEFPYPSVTTGNP